MSLPVPQIDRVGTCHSRPSIANQENRDKTSEKNRLNGPSSLSEIKIGTPNEIDV
jgi:hypothetical protein